MTTALSIRDVHLRFGGVAALDGVEFDVEAGSIVGIIGPNGAGKTTLFDCISGFRSPDTGTIVLAGADGPIELTERAPWERTSLGVGRTFQNARLFKSLPIREVLRAVQHDRMKRSGFVRSVLGLGGAAADEADVAARADEVLELVGLTAHADKPAQELSTGMLRLAELAAVVAVRPSLLLLDEPSSGIAQKETEALGPLLRRLATYLEATVVIIEHDMPLVMGISDSIVAMAAGRVITAGTPDEVRAHPDVLRSYLGADDGLMAPLLEATDLDVHYGKVQVLFGVSITVEEGEFLALLGTNGAGKSTFLKAVSNLSPVTGGRVVFAGEDITNLAPDKIAAKGLAHVPGGRGTLPDLTVEENLRLGGHLLRHDRPALAAGLDRAMQLFPWMGERRRQLAGTLSGGEQQMVAIARALVLRPTLLMVDELSLGLAPVIVEELMGVLKQLNAEGITVLVVEQHATLAMQMSERVLFMEKGQVRFSGAGKDLLGRDDLLRSVFLGA